MEEKLNQIISCSIIMDCRGCGVTINTDRPPFCWDCWCVFDEGDSLEEEE